MIFREVHERWCFSPPKCELEMLSFHKTQPCKLRSVRTHRRISCILLLRICCRKDQCRLLRVTQLPGMAQNDTLQMRGTGPLRGCGCARICTYISAHKSASPRMGTSPCVCTCASVRMSVLYTSLHAGINVYVRVRVHVPVFVRLCSV